LVVQNVILANHQNDKIAREKRYTLSSQ